MLLTPNLLQKVAAVAGCKTTTSAVMDHCLCQKTEDELFEVAQKMVGVSILEAPPCIADTMFHVFSYVLASYFIKKFPVSQNCQSSI